MSRLTKVFSCTATGNDRICGAMNVISLMLAQRSRCQVTTSPNASFDPAEDDDAASSLAPSGKRGDGATAEATCLGETFETTALNEASDATAKVLISDLMLGGRAAEAISDLMLGRPRAEAFGTA